jgi:hypothetical protein
MQRLPRQQLLPDPWFDEKPWMQGEAVANNSWTTNTFSGAVNRAYYLPQVFPVRATLYALRIHTGNTSGNYDLGVYDAAGNKIASTGSTAMAVGIQTLALADISVPAGGLLYAALALSNTAGTIAKIPFTPLAAPIGAGLMEESSALPLPTNMTPVICTTANIPIFVWGVR